LQAEESIKNMAILFADLFAGIGGIREGLQQALATRGLESRCVLTSEIKPHAVKVLSANHQGEQVWGDITKINATDIPDFHILLAGFPCQAFSLAGKRRGFMDTRGTLFFEVERILKEKRPYGFILENVEGLVNHDKKDPKAPMGRTLETILGRLDNLGYKYAWRVLNAKDFGLAQDRRRIYIVGTLDEAPKLDMFPTKGACLADIQEKGLPVKDTAFTRLLLKHYTVKELQGKSIKDKRGGENNIHSWDIELKGAVSEKQKDLLGKLFRERRRKKWAEEIGIDWMDGMTLNEEQIRTFFPDDNLHVMLEDLVEKGYLVKEHPKGLFTEKGLFGERRVRKQDERKPIGYNIVAGKLSFEISKILSPDDIAPTMVAMDMKKNYVVDGEGLRPLSLREGLRLFGYPETFRFPVTADEGYDLLGNTVAVPVIKAVAERLLDVAEKYEKDKFYDSSRTALSCVGK